MSVFEAKLDGLSKIITGLMGPLFVIWPWYLIFSLRTQPDKSYMWLTAVIGVVLIILFIGCYLFMPKSYTLNDGNLSIQRLKGDAAFSISEIASAKAITKIDMGVTIRIMGNGGIFGYTGFFTNKTFGRMNWFVTDKDKMIIIALTNGKHIVISPDDTEGFLKSIKAKK
jgi:hypothetical protein